MAGIGSCQVVKRNPLGRGVGAICGAVGYETSGDIHKKHAEGVVWIVAGRTKIRIRLVLKKNLKRTDTKAEKIERNSIIPLNGIGDRVPNSRSGGWIGRKIKIERRGCRVQKGELIVRLK